MPDNNSSARANVSLARSAEELGDFKAAAQHYAAAAALVRGDLKAWCAHEAAVAFRRTGQYELALSLLETADEVLRFSKDKYLAAQVNLTMGNVLADREHWLRASEYIHKAKEMFDADGAIIESLYARIAAARCWVGLGEGSRAEETYKELSQEGNNFEIRSQALNNLALLYADLGRTAEAMTLLRADIRLCRDAGDVYGEFVAHVNLAQALSREKRFDEAVFHARTALSLGKHYQQTPPFGIAGDIVREAESGVGGT